MTALIRYESCFILFPIIQRFKLIIIIFFLVRAVQVFYHANDYRRNCSILNRSQFFHCL